MYHNFFQQGKRLQEDLNSEEDKVLHQSKLRGKVGDEIETVGLDVLSTEREKYRYIQL